MATLTRFPNSQVGLLAVATGCPELIEITLAGCPYVTQAARDRLEQLLPETYIEMEYPDDV